MSAGREFHVCGAATENARRASSVRTLGTVSSGASDDRISTQLSQYQIRIYMPLPYAIYLISFLHLIMGTSANDQQI